MSEFFGSTVHGVGMCETVAQVAVLSPSSKLHFIVKVVVDVTRAIRLSLLDRLDAHLPGTHTGSNGVYFFGKKVVNVVPTDTLTYTDAHYGDNCLMNFHLTSIIMFSKLLFLSNFKTYLV